MVTEHVICLFAKKISRYFYLLRNHNIRKFDIQERLDFRNGREHWVFFFRCDKANSLGAISGWPNKKDQFGYKNWVELQRLRKIR